MRDLRWYLPAWALYLVSLLLPVAGDLDLPGWEAFLISFKAPFQLLSTPRSELDASAFEVSTYFLPNLLMLLSPLFALRRPGRGIARAMVIAGVVSLVVALLPLRSVNGLQLGYWLWLVSIAILLAAILRQRLSLGGPDRQPAP